MGKDMGYGVERARMLEAPGNTRGYHWACQLGTCTGTTRGHARLVRHQKLNKFLEYIITGIFQLVRQKRGRECGVHLEIFCEWLSLSEPKGLPIAYCVQDSSLEDNHRSGDGLLDLDPNSIRLVLRNWRVDTPRGLGKIGHSRRVKLCSRSRRKRSSGIM